MARQALLCAGVTGWALACGAAELPVTASAGPAGSQSATQVSATVVHGVGTWKTYRDYSFAGASDEIAQADHAKAAEVAAAMAQDPTYRVSIDGASQRRVDIVRDVLLKAGVPNHKMWAGAYGDPGSRQEGRVDVMLTTVN